MKSSIILPITMRTLTTKTWYAVMAVLIVAPPPAKREGIERPTSNIKTVATRLRTCSSLSSSKTSHHSSDSWHIRVAAPTVNAGSSTSRCTVPPERAYAPSQAAVMTAAYRRVQFQLLGARILCIFCQAKNRHMETNIASTVSSHLKPTRNIFKGIINKMVSRSSKIAKILAFLKSHVSLKPAASSMLNRMPALVGAANRAISSAEPQASGLGSA